MTEIFAMFAWSFITVMLWMTGLWVLYLFNRNAGIVDIGWSLGFILTMTISLVIGEVQSAAAPVMALLVYIWAFRLAFHLMNRYFSTSEDPRYTKIKESWGTEHSAIKFLGMFLLQGLLVVILSLPFYLVCASHYFEWHPIQSLALLVWLAGVIGELVADSQLFNFKGDPLNEGKVCESGLWKYSRHPNYFFEWIIWISYALLATPVEGGLFAWISPLIILYLLLKVSGIPMAEAQALETKGDAYLLYQRKISVFIPWIPKE